MKKLISLVVFSVVSVVVIISVITGCKHEDIAKSNREDSFNIALKKLNSQLETLTKISVTRGLEDQPMDESDEEILETAERIDLAIQDFCEANFDTLIKYVREAPLADEEIEAMVVDKSQLLAHVRENYSVGVYNNVNDFLNNELDVTVEEIVDSEDFNPLEKTFMINLKTLSDFQSYIDDVVDNELPDTGELSESQRNHLLDLCETDYMEDVADCGLIAITGGIACLASGGWSCFLAAAAYGQCHYDARKSFKRCRRNVMQQ
jgi:hypothetical protein